MRRLRQLLAGLAAVALGSTALAQSVPNNVTSEMGLALMDVADAIRTHPDVVAFLQRTDDDDFLFFFCFRNVMRHRFFTTR